MTVVSRKLTRVALSVVLALGTAGATVAVAPAADAARPDTVALPDGIQPEGITSSGSTYWVGSLADGRIVAGDLRGDTPSRVLLPGAAGRQLRGLAYDPRTDLVWAVGNVGTVAHVWAVNALSGRVVRDTVVPGGVFLNDLVVTPTAVWVTDSRVARLTRLTLTARGLPTAVSPAFLPLRGAWPGGEAEGIAANGIRVIDRGRVLLDHSGVGGLWTVDLRTGAASAVPVTGRAITGGDGLERRGTTLWVVRGVDDASVSQLRLRITPGAVTATYQRTLTAASLDVPSTATYSSGALYAVNARFGVASPATATYSITRLPTTAART
ncbi:hypothetical protein ACXR2U_11880 [Jatrophihabitans sp. YIM 134969]